ncbi:MAG: hypothetical protein QW478_04145 [Candidatus Micrarchaeaceae archaeon]
MIRQFTFSSQQQTLVVNYDCINGFIVNPNQSPLILQFVDEKYLRSQVSVPALSRMNFQNLRIREINLVSGSGYVIFSPDNEMISDMSIQAVNIANVAKVTFSGLQSVQIQGVTKVTFSGQQDVNIINSVIKVTMSGTQNVNITNAILKVTMSGAQLVEITNSQLDVNITNPSLTITNTTFNVNMLNSVIKVTLSGLQLIDANIVNSIVKVTFSGTQQVEAKITNSTVNVYLSNASVKVTFSSTQNVNITNSQLDVNITNPSIKISNSTFSVSILNSVLKVTLSGTQNINANITNSLLNVNLTNSSIKVTFGSTQNVNITNATLKVTFSSGATVNANITNNTIKVTFSGTQNINIVNSQINANISATNLILPVSEVHGDIKYPIYLNLSTDGVSGLIYNSVYFILYPNSAVKIKSIYFNIQRVFKPQIITTTSQILSTFSYNYTTPIQSLAIFNQLWANSSFCATFQTNSDQIFYSNGDITIMMYKNASTTASICETITSKSLFLFEKDVNYTFLNLGSTTVNFYLEYIDGEHQSYNFAGYITIDFQVLFGTVVPTWNSNYALPGSVNTSSGSGCFDEDTLVLTQRGLKKISEVKRGDLVWNGEEWDESESDAIFMGIEDVYLFDDVWITASQPICLRENDFLICKELKKFAPLSALKKKKDRKVWDIKLKKKVIKFNNFWMLDILKANS